MPGTHAASLARLREMQLSALWGPGMGRGAVVGSCWGLCDVVEVLS